MRSEEIIKAGIKHCIVPHQKDVTESTTQNYSAVKNTTTSHPQLQHHIDLTMPTSTADSSRSVSWFIFLGGSYFQNIFFNK